MKNLLTVWCRYTVLVRQVLGMYGTGTYFPYWHLLLALYFVAVPTPNDNHNLLPWVRWGLLR